MWLILFFAFRKGIRKMDQREFGLAVLSWAKDPFGINRQITLTTACN